MKKNILYLASQSKARQKLLDLAQIPYQIIEHTSNEYHNDVLSIARHKMERTLLPHPETVSTKTIFVLTADTLMQTAKTKQVLGKPTNKEHAKQMLTLLCQEEAELATACCLDQKEFVNGTWHTINSNHWVTNATLTFCVPPNMVDHYFEQMPHAMNACGAGIVEDFGLNFLKEIRGSFTAVLGLPLFELRQALKKMKFFVN